jgi:hypothetical protein
MISNFFREMFAVYTLLFDKLSCILKLSGIFDSILSKQQSNNTTSAVKPSLSQLYALEWSKLAACIRLTQLHLTAIILLSRAQILVQQGPCFVNFRSCLLRDF